MKLWFVAAACLAFSLSPLTMQCEQNFGCSFLNPATQYSGTPADVSTTSIRIVRANSATVEALVGVFPHFRLWTSQDPGFHWQPKNSQSRRLDGTCERIWSISIRHSVPC